MGLEDGSSSRENLIKRMVGEHPTITAKLGGVKVDLVVDSGSQVSLICEDFFKKYLQDRTGTLKPSGSWLKITAANGLDIPYKGFAELDIEVDGVLVPRRGIVVVPGKKMSGASGLLGTNVLQHLPNFKELLGKKTTAKAGFVRVAGRRPVLVPAQSRSCIEATCPKLEQDGLVEPLSSPLPGDLILPAGLVNAKSGRIHIELVNITDNDVWVHPKTRIGVISPGREMTDDLNLRVNETSIRVESSRVSADVRPV